MVEVRGEVSFGLLAEIELQNLADGHTSGRKNQKHVCPSTHPSVRTSLHPSIRPSVRPSLRPSSVVKAFAGTRIEKNTVVANDVGPGIEQAEVAVV